MTPSISIILPTYNRSRFITRAIESVFSQTIDDWELIIIDDGSTDDTGGKVSPYLVDERVRYRRNSFNLGLGASLNVGLSLAAAPFIAYLPDDDLYYEEHLEKLLTLIKGDPDAVLAYSGVRHHYNRAEAGILEGGWLQLVQVLHRRSTQRWVEREELVTDNLDRMYWNALRREGKFLSTGSVTCEWVDHPHQRHKILQEPIGGLQLYKQRYGVSAPLRYHTSTGNLIDEREHFKRYVGRSHPNPSFDGLKILLVGELAYNSDRILALREEGHLLYGLWMRDPHWYNSVGPLPFDGVQDVPFNNWKEAVKKIKPDVIYALLNWQAVPLAHQVMFELPDIPFVWHFKEGPFICLEKGSWSELVDLYEFSDGQIYSSPEMMEWFRTICPEAVNDLTSLVLDGDLPKAEWFSGERSKKLSSRDGEIHTVVPGRPIGLHPYNVEELAAQKIHLHFYGDFTHGQWKRWIENSMKVAGGYLHLHPHVNQDRWVEELSQYDAGWLHFFKSENNGDIRRANWDDLNYPARIATYAAAGLPMIQRDNSGHIVATHRLAQELEMELVSQSIGEIGEVLSDSKALSEKQESIWRHRSQFVFDTHVPTLVSFFRKSIFRHSRRKRRVQGSSYRAEQP